MQTVAFNNAGESLDGVALDLGEVYGTTPMRNRVKSYNSVVHKNIDKSFSHHVGMEKLPYILVVSDNN